MGRCPTPRLRRSRGPLRPAPLLRGRACARRWPPTTPNEFRPAEPSEPLPHEGSDRRHEAPVAVAAIARWSMCGTFRHTGGVRASFSSAAVSADRLQRTPPCCHRADRRHLRRRRVPGACRGRRLGRRAARGHHGGAAGRQRTREPRPRAERHPGLRLRVPSAPRDGEPLPGRHPEGRIGLRSPDRDRGARGCRDDPDAPDRRRGGARRAVARRCGPVDPGRPPGLGPSPSRWRGVRHPAQGQRGRSGNRRRARGGPGHLARGNRVCPDRASAAPDAPRANAPGGTRYRRRPGRRARPGARQTRDRNCRRRRPQPAVHRPARFGQEHVGPAPARHLAGAHL